MSRGQAKGFCVKTPKSTDALDAPRRGGKPGKKQRQAYARAKFEEELVVPPRDGLADFLQNPALLPKRPPARSVVDEDE